ncbi:MAG: thioredoxin family protein [Taibaiella sp.]|nr:thioredoxin family protein [Taibaiella sp.]
MKYLFSALLLCSFIARSLAQDTAARPHPHIYHPDADAAKEIKAAVAKAGAENKHVLLQVGGNWCIWCMRFNDLVTSDFAINHLLAVNYVVVHVNYSPENTNDKVLASLGYPQRFGFPVFVILDGKGNRIHTQNSGYLEEGQGHSKKKVAEFLKQWSPAALSPESYLNKSAAH